MERLASGNVSYEIADALISENKITVELDADETIEGDIAIVGKNSMDIKGIGYSSDSHNLKYSFTSCSYPKSPGS